MVSKDLHEHEFIDVKSFFNLSCHSYFKGLDGKYIQCNTSQALSHGCANSSEVIGLSDKEFHCRKDTKLITDNDKIVANIKKPIIVVESVVFKNNSASCMLSFKIPVKDVKGKLIGVMGVSTALDDNGSLVHINEEMITICSSASLALGKAAMAEPNIYHMIKISRREKQCLNFLLHGLSTKSMASLLKLSPRTIEFYIANLKIKYECSNRLELVAKAPIIMQQFNNKLSA